MWKKKKERLREIEIEKIENIKELLNYSWQDIADLLNVSLSQVANYRKSGKVPADRYYAARDALLLAGHQELRDRERRIIELFS